MNNAEFLIEIIFDKEADWAEKQDAIFYLSSYTQDFVINALKKFIIRNEDQILKFDASEALIKIWIKLNKFDLDYFKILPKNIQLNMTEVLGYDKPDWLPFFNKILEN